MFLGVPVLLDPLRCAELLHMLLANPRTTCLYHAPRLHTVDVTWELSSEELQGAPYSYCVSALRQHLQTVSSFNFPEHGNEADIAKLCQIGIRIRQTPHTSGGTGKERSLRVFDLTSHAHTYLLGSNHSLAIVIALICTFWLWVVNLIRGNIRNRRQLRRWTCTCYAFEARQESSASCGLFTEWKVCENDTVPQT